MVSLQHSGFCPSLARFEGWYNEVRPHSSMSIAKTPSVANDVAVTSVVRER